MKLIELKTFDKKILTVNVWDEVKTPKGVVVISHGMAEHAERYADFASFLNANEFVVLGGNHRGHRYNNAGEKGLVDGDSYSQSVEDIRTVVNYAKSEYGKDVTLLGHSYGSFLAQRFIELYSAEIVGCVLSGTAHMKNMLISLGNGIASIQKALFGSDKVGNLINKMSFGSYNKPFREQGQDFAWLSRDKEQVAKYEADEYCGYPLSIGYYSSFFKGVLRMYGEDTKNIRKDIPVLIAVGSQDPVSNKSVLAKKLYDFYLNLGLTDVEYKVYEDARHEILNETNRQEVYDDILSFIVKNY